MNSKSKFIVILSISLWVLTGCGAVESDSTPNKTAVAGVSIEVMDASSDNYKVKKLNGDKNLQVKLGSEKKDLYILVSNPSETTLSAEINHHQRVTNKIEKVEKEIYTKDTLNLTTYLPTDIQEFNNRVIDLESDRAKNVTLKKIYKSISDIEDVTKKTFYMDLNASGKTVDATARKVIKNIQTEFGEKSLTIWVENATYGDGCSKVKCINDNMIDILANKFLKEGLDNDIYDWVTTVFGEEWGEPSSSSLIEKNDHISILLTDISQDNVASGGVIGYFHSKDNFTTHQYSGSNERIMFYIDSVMFANATGSSWDENDFWPQQVFSTLAHEFQHMIYFYQKNVKRHLSGTKTWLNEMLSESTEDLVAVKMNIDGPRNVVASRGDAGDKNNHNGRYPLFNEKNTINLKSWDNTLENYSTVSSFGAYLLRNYGGAELLHNIVDNNLLNEDALMYAVHQHVNGKSKTFDDLIHEWGIAVLLSKRDDISIDSGVLYNAGDFISSNYNGIQYNLGSINFFNYSTPPSVATTIGRVSSHTNYYYKVGEDLSGDVDVDILGTAGLNVSVVVVK
jgi:hypothetical protein